MRKSWVERHPVGFAFGILFGCAAVVAWWPLFLALAIISGIGYGAVRVHPRA
jgi:hypothetical protein